MKCPFIIYYGVWSIQRFTGSGENLLRIASFCRTQSLEWFFVAVNPLHIYKPLVIHKRASILLHLVKALRVQYLSWHKNVDGLSSSIFFILSYVLVDTTRKTANFPRNSHLPSTSILHIYITVRICRKGFFFKKLLKAHQGSLHGIL